MFILETKDARIEIPNTLCKQGAFYIVYGAPSKLDATYVYPFQGTSVNWLDERNSHPNWSQAPGFTYSGQSIFLTPASGGIMNSTTTTWTCNTATTVDGIFLANSSLLFAAALLPSQLSFSPGDTALLRFEYRGTGVTS